MGKSVKNPKRFIISCRVNDQEMQILQERANQAGTNISNLLRDSLDIPEFGRQQIA
ncbi:hydrogen-dependent growth transcriptional repressor [Geothermobacter hydrogeniphilus]|uniref:Hydrogen-dependent growth transcriptional repressor n=1 Tax=Geothermobacter hydrogeniphilus TaxID=1969733 RepID=A0A1X0XPR6_9BACT|nr:hydrogen-dependent growth transcriptional repressor [Geothermobacter hydrogeniphilus]ORJ54909.1 hydrogen-dependent growth transcriptional repressor [Geothermobacter hydrogeniphilus]PNU20235.1 hydrogen-dependent growth transcriptional repressor [Geothermobacter hydrogeniphilus]